MALLLAFSCRRVGFYINGLEIGGGRILPLPEARFERVLESHARQPVK